MLISRIIEISTFVLLIRDYEYFDFLAAHEAFGIPNAGIRIGSVAIHPRKKKGLDVVIKSLRIIVSDVIMAIQETEYVKSKTVSF